MKKVKIALLGLGTVGSGVWQILKSNKNEITRKCGYEIEVAKILVRNKDKKRAVDVPKEIVTTNFNDILNDDSINIVVEVMGGIDPTNEYIISSIMRKKHIVTANKMLLAINGHEIYSTAKREGVSVHYEASVAGGIPIINNIKESLTANKIEELYGIVNGTTNYILTKMQFENMTFEDALKEAQEKGYVEADMSSDIDAYDAQYKLSILSSLAFNSKINVNEIYREGIANITSQDISYAKDLGYAIKLLAIAKNIGDALELRVHPTMIPETHPLANVHNCFNSVFVKGNAVGELMFYGRGAGDLPTGSAVVGDIISVLRNEIGVVKDSISCELDNKSIKHVDDIESEYYIRVTICDDKCYLGKVISTLEEQNVTIKSIKQGGDDNGNFVITLITNISRENSIRKAIDIFGKQSITQEINSIIRIENL